MKTIEMTTDMGGKLHGSRYEVEDGEARDLVAKGYAFIVKKPRKAKPAPKAAPKQAGGEQGATGNG